MMQFPTARPSGAGRTAGVTNQSPPYEDANFYDSNPVLQEYSARLGPAECKQLGVLGAQWGSARFLELGRLANTHTPKLVTHDPRGERIDFVEFHPAWYSLMQAGMAAGLHNLSWTGGSHTSRAIRLFMAYQAEAGHVCPLTMTHAALAALRAEPDIAGQWRHKITGLVYDPTFRPWWEKSAVTIGMGMTEKQGGTDVRANITQAVKAGDHFEITGHKWFMSAPMCDGFLILAQAPGGLSCFLLPRFTPDGDLNRLHFQRLKDKLGNRSNASSEVEFDQAFAQRIGEEGRGVRTIINMVQLTRLDCVVASAGLMRFGLASAVHHARHRSVFQRRLIDQPLMRATLADMALEVEALTALALRLAAAFDTKETDESEASYARLITPAAKYYVCKIAPSLLYEAMECHGGNGYVEELPLARAYREAPVNAIWEGSGNVIALDLLRAVAAHQEEALALIDGIAAQCPSPVHDVIEKLKTALAGRDREAHARFIAGTLARLAAAAALAQHQPLLSGHYIRARIQGSAHATWGSVPHHDIAAQLLDRAGR